MILWCNIIEHSTPILGSYLLRIDNGTRNKFSVFVDQGWNPYSQQRLSEAKAENQYLSIDQELESREQRWLDTVVVLTVNYTDKSLLEALLLDSNMIPEKSQIFVFQGKYIRKNET